MVERGEIILFRSTHDAIRAEQALIEKGYTPRVIPVPKKISPDCGIALLVEPDVFEEAKELLHNLGVHITGHVQRASLKGV